MSKEGPGPTHCSQKRSVGVKKKGRVNAQIIWIKEVLISFIFLLFSLKIGCIEQGPMILS